MSQSQFELRDNQIFSTVTGDLVAVVEGGKLKMQPGKNAMTPKVKAFWESCPKDPEAAPVPPIDPAPLPEPDEEEVNTHLLGDDGDDEGKIFFGGAPEVRGTSIPLPEKKPTPAKSVQALAVWDIPEQKLPRFDPALGTATPEFKKFVQQYQLSREQVAELITRLERKVR